MDIVGLTASLSFDNKASSSAIVRRPSTNSNVDFDDVFGGPPTWTRYSYSGSRMKKWEETTISPTGSVEMPVFGEPHSSPRTCASDDLFDDSFRRSGQYAGSPRWRSHMLGSRTLRPAECVDIPVFGSHVNTQNNNHLSRFLTPAIQTVGNNSGRSAGQTLLSCESPSVIRSIEKDIDHKSKARRGSSNIEFHFSMHNWANVGVPLLMSLHEGIHSGRSKVSALSIDNIRDSGFPKEDLSAEKQDMNLVSSKKKLEVKKVNSSNKGEANKRGVGSPKNRVKGMVKGFFKMSNQESPPRTKTNVKEEIKRSNNQEFEQNRTDRKLEDINFQDDASPAYESVTNGSKASVEMINEPSLDHFWGKELAPVEDKLSKTQQESEAIMLWIQISICGQVEEQETFTHCSPLYNLYFGLRVVGSPS